MKSFKNYLSEDKNVLQAAQLLIMRQDDIDYHVLCVRSAIPNAIILVTDPNHPDYANLISTDNLPSDIEFRIPDKLKNRVPISNYLFQQKNFAPIKKIEYHDEKKNMKESLSSIVEDLDKSSFHYFLAEFRRIKRTDKINEKLNLILEIIFSSEADHRIHF